MFVFENPALNQFVAELGEELVFAQVLVRRTQRGFELCHAADRGTAREALRKTSPAEARELAQSTEAGNFRPLKAAPTLRRGWRITAANETELETALSRLYPGALADWWAARAPEPPVTNYREFTSRQTGMYRVTAKLDDEAATRVIRAGCAPAQCLKRRLWTVGGLAPDVAADKSLIPCLEPCAVLLELARREFRVEQNAAAAKGSAGDLALADGDAAD